MSSAQDFVSLIRNMVRDEINKMDRVIPCTIVTYNKNLEKADIKLISDENTIIYGINNFSKFIFVPGDTAYVYLVQNRLSDSFIIGKQGGVNGTPSTY